MATTASEVPSLPNFRHLPGTRLYRSANPARMLPDDVTAFARLGIAAILDLRSKDSESSSTSTTRAALDRYYTTIVINTDVAARAVRDQHTSGSSTSGSGDVDQVDDLTNPSAKKPHFFVDLHDVHWGMGLFSKAGWFAQAYCVFFLVTDKISGTHRSLAPIFNDRGDSCEIYKNTVERGGGKLCAALTLLTRPENVPALVCCSIGKDRTGLLVALVLSVLGKARDFIAADYAKSESQLLRDNVDVEGEMKAMGFQSWALRSDYSTMMTLLDFVDQRYGSVDRYLDSIGFGEGMRRQLKNNLSVRTTSAML